jgi:hypothetical protein
MDARTATPNEKGRRTMEIPKDKIIQMLKDRGDHDKATAAERELPDKVDPEEHSNLLEKHGIDPKELLGGLGGKIPGL